MLHHIYFHSLIRPDLLSTCYVPDTVVGTWDTKGNKTEIPSQRSQSRPGVSRLFCKGPKSK